MPTYQLIGPPLPRSGGITIVNIDPERAQAEELLPARQRPHGWGGGTQAPTAEAVATQAPTAQAVATQAPTAQAAAQALATQAPTAQALTTQAPTAVPMVRVPRQWHRGWWVRVCHASAYTEGGHAQRTSEGGSYQQVPGTHACAGFTVELRQPNWVSVAK